MTSPDSGLPLISVTSPTSFELLSVDDSHVGTYEAKAAFMIPFTDFAVDVNFKIYIESCAPDTLTAQPVKEQVYVVSQSALTIQFSEFAMTPQCTTDALLYKTSVYKDSVLLSDTSDFLTKVT